jgi:uroporphyrinogen-III synthase
LSISAGSNRPGARKPEPAGILVTRPEPGLTETSAQLHARGFRPVAAALLRIEPLPFARTPAARPQAALVTSAHALGSLDPAGIPQLLAVGDATAARARSLGIRQVRSAAGDAASLVALCRAHLTPAGGPLLLLCGEGQALRLATELRGLGFRVIRRVVYAQRPVPTLPPDATASLAAGTLAASLFMSASAAAIFARLLPAELHPNLKQINALAISEAASRPVSALPWRSVRVALRPTAEDVLALL